MESKRGRTNPHAKNTYRVLNEPFKLLGILDWRYAFFAGVPSTVGGLIGHSWLAGVALFAICAWSCWRIQEDDPNRPLVWLVTFGEKKNISPFDTATMKIGMWSVWNGHTKSKADR